MQEPNFFIVYFFVFPLTSSSAVEDDVGI